MPGGKGPDPAEFEPDVVVGDDDAPSRVETPQPAKGKPEALAATDARDPNGVIKEQDGESKESDRASTPVELPPEVRLRLRRLEKLEPKYTGTRRLETFLYDYR